MARKRSDCASTLCAFHGRLLLGELFSSTFILVEGGEVVADDGDGECDDENAADGAAGADDLAQSRHGTDVSVSDLLYKRRLET